MGKFENDDNVIPFEGILIEMYDNRTDLNHLKSTAEYLQKKQIQLFVSLYLYISTYYNWLHKRSIYT